MWINLALNTLGGILAGLAFAVWGWLRRRLANWQFQQIFGSGVSKRAFSLIYEELALAKPSSPFPYVKPGGDPSSAFSISRPVPVCTVRALNYLAGTIGKNAGTTPNVQSDLDTRSLLDFDFVSFGGPGSNFKTADCQSNSGNRLAIFDQPRDRFISLSDGKPLVEFASGFDYGLILKVRPSQFPRRVWIVCAGWGEWGTSGAAWYLANKWDQIRKEAGNRPFAVLVRLRPGQDESVEVLRIIVAQA